MNRTKRKEAGSWQPTGVKLGRPRPKLGWTSQVGPNLGLTRRTRATWLRLEPNWGPTWRDLSTSGRKLGLTCAVCFYVGASVAQLGPKTAQRGGHGVARPPLFASASYSFGVRRRIYRSVWALSPAAATFCQRCSTRFLHGDLASVGTKLVNWPGKPEFRSHSHTTEKLCITVGREKRSDPVWQAKKVKGWKQVLGFLDSRREELEMMPQVAWTAVGRSLSQRRRNWFLQWLARAGKLVAKTTQPIIPCSTT